MSPTLRLLAVLAVAALAVAGALTLLGSDDGPARLVPGSGQAPGDDGDEVDPLAYTREREDELVAAAARGHAHV
ncbi:MAG: hypothetical protein H0T43_00965, partial [Solirubrobacterales bacterium]|nr:hypothetical protein [Solirubrobacterales bacterium]